jgi:hypothetical protein
VAGSQQNSQAGEDAWPPPNQDLTSFQFKLLSPGDGSPHPSSGPARGIRPLFAFISSQVWSQQGSVVSTPRARGMQVVQIGQRCVNVKGAPQFRDGLTMLVHPQVEVRILLVSDHPQRDRYLAALVSASGLAGLECAEEPFTE